VQFSAGTATVQGVTNPIASFGSNVQTITMVGAAAPHSVEAQPNTLSGGAFSVTWFNP
jgi:hypothetical protein